LLALGAVVGRRASVARGGIALLLFHKDGVPVSAVTADVYRLMVSPTLPAVPLLTACGYVLAESKASTRLVRFFRRCSVDARRRRGSRGRGLRRLRRSPAAPALRSWRSAGCCIDPAQRRLFRRFSLGLVTASGSLGLLLPPSLPVILYAIVAKVPPDSLYLAGLVPGILLIVIVALYGIRVGWKLTSSRHPFSMAETLRAGWAAKCARSVPLMRWSALPLGSAMVKRRRGVAYRSWSSARVSRHPDPRPPRVLPLQECCAARC
jgi:hypothetical protein